MAGVSRYVHSRRKRCLDLVLAGLAFIPAAPIMAIAALAIRIESPGHPIYRQRRVGRDRHEFDVIKLRTMVSGAEQMGARLAVRPGLSGWAQVNGRASLPWTERIELDIWYLEHASLRLDLRILYLSARMAITGHGLYRGETGGWRQ